MTTTPIASLVKVMLAGGAAPDAIVRAVEAAELQGQPRGKALVTIGPQRRGMRLPDNWQPSERCIAYALDHSMTRERIEIEIERFKNYWLEKTGAGATKLTWEGTWRNWILNALERRNVPARFKSANGTPSHIAPGRSATGNDATLTGMGRLANRVVARRASAGGNGEDGKNAHGADAPAELDFDRRGTGSDRGSHAPTE